MRPATVLVALGLGAAVGALARLPAGHLLVPVLIWLEPFGTIFIKLITMVIVPLVVSSLFVAVASLDSIGRLGRIGGATLVYFVATTFAAAAIGALVALICQGPGGGVSPLLAPASAVATAPSDWATTLVSFVPDNLIAAASRADLLPLLLGVCLFGAAATLLEPEPRRLVLDVFRAIDRLSAIVLGWIMRLAPPAVFVLIAASVARSGATVLGDLAWFAVVVVLALMADVVLMLIPALMALARHGLMTFLRETSDALVLAFSTASSSAALPVSLAAADRLRVPAEVGSLVLPAGATVNKNGAAVYKAVTAVFVAHWVGLALGAGLVVRIVLVATMAAFTGAGIPGSSLVTTMTVLRAIGLGEEASAAIALVAGIDRPLDMCRTAVNTFGNLVGSAVVARVAARRP